MKTINMVIIVILALGLSLTTLSLDDKGNSNELKDNVFKEVKAFGENNVSNAPEYAYPGLIWKTNKLNGEMEVLRDN